MKRAGSLHVTNFLRALTLENKDLVEEHVNGQGLWSQEDWGWNFPCTICLLCDLD